MSTLLTKIDRFLNGPASAQASGAHQEWDRLRAAALTPQERSEIDAIFARQIDSL